MKPSSTGAPYKVPRQHDGWRSLTLAGAMHAVLILFLWVGVHWQSNKPVAVEAEVWDMSVQQAAPPAPTPPPTPAPEPEPEPVVKAPPPPVAPPVEAPPAPKAPDIALERLKAKKKLAEEKLQEAKEAAKLQKEADEKLAKLKAKEEAKKKELAEQKAQEEKEKKDELDKKLQAEKDKQLQAEKDKKAAADKLAAKAKADKAAADKMRAAEMSRITGAVGAGAVGTAAKSTGPKGDAGYAGALQAAIRSRLAYSSSDDTLTATVTITQLPTGEVIGTRMKKSSGVAAYDNAILRAIEAASPLPKKKDGTVEREITADFNLKDLH